MERKILITGCGRSGSKYVSVLMRALGFDLPHEKLGRDGVCSWYMAADADSVPIGPANSNITFDYTFHLVREPLAAIESITQFSDGAWEFISQHIPCSEDEPILLRSAKYWYYWNQLAKQKANVFLKVEDTEQIIKTLSSELKIKIDFNHIKNIPSNVNTRKSGRIHHLIEELFIRLKFFKLVIVLNKVINIKPAPKISWLELEKMDKGLTDLIKEEAKYYGYV